MYYKKLLKNGAIIIAAAMLTLAACKKSDSTTSTTATTPASADDNGGYASDGSKMETTSNDVISISDAAATSGTTNLQRTTTPYPTVTFTTSGSDTIMTINYGTGHLCLDGKTRSGEIIVTYNGPYKATGTVRTITYSSYFVDGNQVSGLKTVTNEGTNDSGQVWYDVVLNDTMHIGTTDSVISWTGHRTRTWLQGYSTATRTDDVYSIADATGSAGTVLTRANGHVFTFAITTPLTVALSCANIEAGVLTITSPSFTDGLARVLDYSYGPVTGGCDDLAQLTIGTHDYIIFLH